MPIRKAALVLLLPIFGCGSPSGQTVGMSTEGQQECTQDNGAWCIAGAQAAVAQDTETSIFWSIRDSLDNTGLIIEPKSCRNRSADGVYRRTSGTVLREGENWKLTRIGLREDRTCEVLFMAPASASDSLQTVFQTQINICDGEAKCAALGDMLMAATGRRELF